MFNTEFGWEEVILSPRPEDWGDFFTEDYAEIRADLKARGSLIGANDLLIAAHARSLDLTLITNNMAELSRVAGLPLENWTEAP